MKAEVHATTEVVVPNTSFKGKLTLSVKELNRSKEFPFTIENPTEDNFHLVISKDDRPYLDVRGPFGTKDAANLTLAQQVALKMFIEPISSGAEMAKTIDPRSTRSVKVIMNAFGGDLTSSSQTGCTVEVPREDTESLTQLLS